MILTIENGTKLQRKAVKEMVPWLGKKLLPRIYKNLEITVQIFDLMKEEGCWGGAFPDEDYTKVRYPRHFVLAIHNKMKMYDFRITLCHEFVHIFHFAKGHMYSYENGSTRWKNKIHDSSMGEGLSYWEVPWEEEARGKQEGLFQLWLAYKKDCKKNGIVI